MTLPVLRSSTSPGRWDPWREFTDLQNRMGQLMQSVFEPLGEVAQTLRPLADVSETEDSYVVEVEVPGVRREDIAIEAVGNELTITGEFREKEKVGWLRSRTRRTGHFEHRTVLPRDVDPEKITAELAQGVLTVTVPKTEAAKPRRIEITGR
ncbi:MAG TPA: Hsp20/alpha crystallin family protein [Pseudonocardiaceae bacterium]|jgi:HSP20 family protein|nr:Hsp20/alpha crystallin family protein [Pseudonocardiaceae bacterium]